MRARRRLIYNGEVKWPKFESSKSLQSTKLRKALFAAITAFGVSGEPQESVAQNIGAHATESTGRESLAPKTPDQQTEDMLRFRDILDSTKQTPEDRVWLETTMLTNAVPLAFQLQFLQIELGEGGYLYREYNDPSLERARLLEIFEMVHQASQRLTNAYHDPKMRMHPSYQRYFNIDKVLNAARTLPSSKTGRSYLTCNEFLTQNEGQVYGITDNHCLTTPALRNRYTEVSVENDQALRGIPDNMYKAEGILSPEDLPPLATGVMAAGRVAVSCSWRPGFGGQRNEGVLRDSNAEILEVEFSIALPVPTHVARMLYTEETLNESPEIFNSMMIMRSLLAAKILTVDEKGKPKRIGGSGTSGSFVGIETGVPGANYAVLGNTISIVPVPDTGGKAIKYPLSTVGNTASLLRLAQQNRERMVFRDVEVEIEPSSEKKASRMPQVTRGTRTSDR